MIMRSFEGRVWVAIAFYSGLLGCVMADQLQDHTQAVKYYEATYGTEHPDKRLLKNAVELWTRLSIKGDPQAKYFLSTAYFSGAEGVLERSYAKGVELLTEAAELEVPQAQFSLAHKLEKGVPHVLAANPTYALQMYERAARNGYSLAISRLTYIYTHGELGIAPDPKKVSYWSEEQKKTHSPNCNASSIEDLSRSGRCSSPDPKVEK